MLNTYYVLWFLEEIGIFNGCNTDPKVRGLFLILSFIYSSNQQKLYNMEGETRR